MLFLRTNIAVLCVYQLVDHSPLRTIQSWELPTPWLRMDPHHVMHIDCGCELELLCHQVAGSPRWLRPVLLLPYSLALAPRLHSVGVYFSEIPNLSGPTMGARRHELRLTPGDVQGTNQWPAQGKYLFFLDKLQPRHLSHRLHICSEQHHGRSMLPYCMNSMNLASGPVERGVSCL